MCPERQSTDGEAAGANCQEQPRILECEISARPGIKQLGLAGVVAPVQQLEWMGPRAFQCRFGVQPDVERDSWMCVGRRRDQRICHHHATATSPTDLVYVYDRMWDEYAALATNVPASAVGTIVSHALAIEVER